MSSELQMAYLGAALTASPSELAAALPDPAWFTATVGGVPLGRVADLVRTMVTDGQDVKVVSVWKEAQLRAGADPVFAGITLSFLDSAIHKHGSLGGFIDDYATRLSEISINTQVIEASEQLARLASGNGDWRGLVDHLVHLAANTKHKLGESILETFDKFVASERAFRESGGVKLRLRTGMAALDRNVHMTGGKLITIGARTSNGKSVLAGQIALAAALDGIPVAYYTTEMTEEEMMQRLMSQFGVVSLGEMIDGGFVYDPVKVDALRRRVEALPISTVQNSYSSTILTDMTRRIIADGVKVVVVDFVQDVTFERSGFADESWRQALAGFIKRLKGVARRYKVVVIAAAQLNREAGKMAKTNERPSLHHLKESGAFEESSDIVLLQWRYPDDKGGLSNDSEIIWAKQRNGPTGSAEFIFVPERSKFMDIPSFAGDDPASNF